MDADNDRGGLVGMQEFDFMIENAPSLSRRFRLATSWTEVYGDINTFNCYSLTRTRTQTNNQLHSGSLSTFGFN